MFGSTKVKVAAGLAAGALTLGAAGAYAAANSDSVSLATAKPVTLTGASAPKLISLSGNTTLTLPAKFKNQGECVSTFAKKQGPRDRPGSRRHEALEELPRQADEHDQGMVPVAAQQDDDQHGHADDRFC